MDCNYCIGIAIERPITTGKYIDCTFWECPQCRHAWMSDEQEEQKKRVDMGLDITSKPTDPR